MELDRIGIETVCKYDVVCLSETWLTEPPTRLYINSSHNCIFAPAKPAPKTGHAPQGMIMYYNLTTLELLKTEEKSSDLIIARFRMKKNNGEMTIVSVYNDPNSYQAAFGRLNSAFLTHSLDSRRSVIVGGDFNGRT